MHGTRQLALFSAFALLAPLTASTAEAQWDRPAPQTYGFSEGFDRGQRAGVDDARRGDAFQFTDEGDYRRGDVAYRSEYGNRDRYREEFRRGFEAGYRAGFAPYRYNNGRGNNGRWGGPGGPWGRGGQRFDLAYETGFNDGYEEGLDAARDERRFDPVGESRYRSADRGYEREYGSKDAYRNNYRDAFRDGYSRGYDDGRRYRNSRPWWNPF